MSPLRTHFEERATSLSDCADLQCTEDDGYTRLRLTPHRPNAVGVVLHLGPGGYGTVNLDDQAAVPAELGEDLRCDLAAIDTVIDTAVHGRATTFHSGHGGCVEESRGRRVARSWHDAFPWPGWRRRSVRVDYVSYR